MEAAIRVIGTPLKHFGDGQFSMRERTPANKTMLNKKPRPTPNDENIDWIKLKPSVMLFKTTPKTAQLVVISGKYTPSDL